MTILQDVSDQIADSQARDAALYLLGNVPGLPPIVQTLHLLSIAVIMGSIVLINLRVLGLALPSQQLGEMTGRLMPWTWGALPVLLLSGGIFVLARPGRYFFNPVFGWKFALLLPALMLALLFHQLSRKHPNYWESSLRRLRLGRLIAAVSLLLWIGVTMAGRWIAYTEYLFWPG